MEHYGKFQMDVILKQPLPGIKAHFEMAPRNRILAASGNAMNAAVLVLLTPENDGCTATHILDWRVLLIRRNSYPGVHSGQIAFPGGKSEGSDKGFWDTACREAYEEVGVDRRDFQRIGALSNVYVAPSNFLIHPFVAMNTSVRGFRTDPREVVDFKNVPVKVFDPAAADLMYFTDREGRERAAPAWNYENYTVWGATAMILAELYRLIVEGTLACS